MINGYRGVSILAICLTALLSLSQNCSGLDGFKVKEVGSDTALSISPFTISRPATRILPLPMRVSKIENLMAGSDPGAFTLINQNARQFGEYDHANGVAADLSWSESRIASWTKAIQPVCQSGVLRGRYAYPSSAETFVRRAYGRELNASDRNMLAQVAGASASDSDKFQILCTVVLSSLEFNSL